MIVKHDSWYSHFVKLLATYDAGDWQKAEDELKLYNLKKIKELTFSYFREGGGMKMEEELQSLQNSLSAYTSELEA